MLTTSRDMVFSSKQTMLQNQASVISSSLNALDVLSVDSVSRVMNLLDVTELTGITVRRSNGEILYDTINLTPVSSKGLEDIRSTTALGGSAGFYGHFNEGTFKCWYYLPLMHNDSITGILVLYDNDSSQGSVLLNLQYTVRVITIVACAVTLMVIAILVVSVSTRVNRILHGIVPVGEGNYSSRINLTGRDELTELADAFDSMTQRLEETEATRRRFIADASHELKTPLASIRLLSDSILQTDSIDAETVQEFVGDIGSEAERLAHTTERLLALTRLDSNQITERSPRDMSTAARYALRILTPIAKERNIALYLDATGSCMVNASEEELHQIVQNLMENAIKYNVDDGSVNVRLRTFNQEVILTVDDTGVGVPEEDLPHIFDRFYRVDKARSREAGGSGLGLSIVNDTVKILGGRINAIRRNEGGMRFQVFLPEAAAAGGGKT